MTPPVISVPIRVGSQTFDAGTPVSVLQAAIDGVMAVNADWPKALRPLAGQWHRAAETELYYLPNETDEYRKGVAEGKAQALRRCAEELEKIVGQADPF